MSQLWKQFGLQLNVFDYDQLQEKAIEEIRWLFLWKSDLRIKDYVNKLIRPPLKRWAMI
jgi:hypothetical protein